MRAIILSCGYRIVRAVLSKLLFFFQRVFLQRRDLETLVTVGDKGLHVLHSSPLRSLVFVFPKPHLHRDVLGLSFHSPLTFAAFKDDLTLIHIWKELGIGGGSLKTIMSHARPGNQRPRLQEVRSGKTLGFINALGLPGKGVSSVLSSLESSGLINQFPLGFSVGGNTTEEYDEVVAAIVSWNQKIHCKKMYLELNISCPNTDHGRSLSEDMVALEALLTRIRLMTDMPVFVKVSPDQPDTILQQTAELVSQVSQCGINAGNTQFRTRESVGFSEREFSRVGGGLSGPFLFQRTCDMLALLKPFSIPIISTGGVSTADDVELLLSQGASLVGMATQLVKDPYIIPKIHSRLVQ